MLTAAADSPAPSRAAAAKQLKFEQRPLQLLHTRGGTASQAPPSKLLTHAKLYWGCARASGADDDDDADDLEAPAAGGLLELYVRSEISEEADDSDAPPALADEDAREAARVKLTQERLQLLKKFARSYYILFVTEDQAQQMNLPPGMAFGGKVGECRGWHPTREMIDSQRTEGSGPFRGVFRASRVLLVGLGVSSSVCRAGVQEGVQKAIDEAAARGAAGKAVAELSFGVLRTSNAREEQRVGGLPVEQFFDAAARKLVQLHCSIPGVQQPLRGNGAGGARALPGSKVARVLFDDMSLFTLGDNFISVHLFNDSAHFDKTRTLGHATISVALLEKELDRRRGQACTGLTQAVQMFTSHTQSTRQLNRQSSTDAASEPKPVITYDATIVHKMRVDVLRCSDLKDVEILSKSDPFVEVFWQKSEQPVLTTVHRDNNLNPTWSADKADDQSSIDVVVPSALVEDESARARRKSSVDGSGAAAAAASAASGRGPRLSVAIDPEQYELKFVVRDHETYRAHRFLGQYTMPGTEVFGHLARGNTFEIALKLKEDDEKKSKKKDKGAKLGHLYIALSVQRKFRIENVKFAPQGTDTGAALTPRAGARAIAGVDPRLRPVDNYFHFSWNFAARPANPQATTFIWAHRFDEDLVKRRQLAKTLPHQQINFVNHYEGRRYRIKVHCFPPGDAQGLAQAADAGVPLLPDHAFEFPPRHLIKTSVLRKTRAASQMLQAGQFVDAGALAIGHDAYGSALVTQIRQGTTREASVQFVRALGNVRIKGGENEVGEWVDAANGGLSMLFEKLCKMIVRNHDACKHIQYPPMPDGQPQNDSKMLGPVVLKTAQDFSQHHLLALEQYEGSAQPQLIQLDYIGNDAPTEDGKQHFAAVLVGTNLGFEATQACGLSNDQLIARVHLHKHSACTILGVMDALSKLRPQINVRAVLVCADFSAEPGKVIAPRKPLVKEKPGVEEGRARQIRYIWEDPKRVPFHGTGDGQGDKPSYYWPPSNDKRMMMDIEAEGELDVSYPEGEDDDDVLGVDEDGAHAMRAWLADLGIKQEHCYIFEQAGLDRKSEFLAFDDSELAEVYKVLTQEPFSVPPFHVKRVCRAVEKQRTKAAEEDRREREESIVARGGVMTSAGAAAGAKRGSTIETPLMLSGSAFRQMTETRREKTLICDPKRWKAAAATPSAAATTTSAAYARRRAARAAAARSASTGAGAHTPPLPEAHRCVQTQSAGHASKTTRTMASKATHRHEEVATALCLADAIKFAASTATASDAQDSCFIVLSTLASHSANHAVPESVVRDYLVKRQKPDADTSLSHILLEHRRVLGDPGEHAGGGGQTPFDLEEHYYRGLLEALGITFDGEASEAQPDATAQLAKFLLPFGQRNFDAGARRNIEWLHMDLSSVSMDATARNAPEQRGSLLAEADVARWQAVVKGLVETGTPERLTKLADKMKAEAEKKAREAAPKLVADKLSLAAEEQASAQDVWKLPSEVEAKAWDTTLLACDNSTGWGVELLIDFVLQRKKQLEGDEDIETEVEVQGPPNDQDTQTWPGWDGHKSLKECAFKAHCPDTRNAQGVLTLRGDDDAATWTWKK